MASFGDTLKQARAHKGVTLKEAEQATRINRNHLAALEDENFAALPPLIYQRGIVRNYAMYLGLDASKALSLFEEARGGEDTVAGPGVEAVPPVNMPSHWAPNFAIIAFSVVLSAIVFAWTYSAFVQDPIEEAATPAIVATVTPFASDVALPTEPPSAPTPTLEPTAPPTEAAAAGPVETGRDGTQPGGDNMLDAAPPAEEAPAEEPPAEAAPAEGTFVTSIAVTAVDNIFVSIVADGVPVFEGEVPAGQTTNWVTGTTFEVYTSSGANTTFVNSCNAPPFNMGYEPGEAFYILQADAESCAPIQ